ncbi:MAG TPA: hypothetical protein VF283_07530 [Bryobacteraceae bacterium]
MAYGIEELRGSTPSVASGVGNSLAGFKYRFFETRENKAGESSFAMSIYPQLLSSVVGSSVDRGVAEPGQFYLPFEFSGRLGPLAFSAEAGHWFARQQIPGAWTQAVVFGGELSKRSEVFAETYHTVDVQVDQSRAVPDLTLGVGVRESLRRDGPLRVLAMIGHSLLPPEPTGTRPQWIAYIGLQILTKKGH